MYLLQVLIGSLDCLLPLWLARAITLVLVFMTLLTDWFIGLSTSVVIGQSDYFGFGFYDINGKLLYFAILITRNIYSLTAEMLQQTNIHMKWSRNWTTEFLRMVMYLHTSEDPLMPILVWCQTPQNPLNSKQMSKLLQWKLHVEQHGKSWMLPETMSRWERCTRFFWI